MDAHFVVFAYDFITVSSAWELLSVFMCYRGRFSTSLSRLLSDSDPLYVSVVYGVSCSLYFIGCSCRWHGHVLPGTTLIKIMCVHQLYEQG